MGWKTLKDKLFFIIVITKGCIIAHQNDKKKMKLADLDKKTAAQD